MENAKKSKTIEKAFLWFKDKIIKMQNVDINEYSRKAVRKRTANK